VVGALDDIAAIEDLLTVTAEEIPAQQTLVNTYKTSLEKGTVDVLSYYTAVGDLQQKKLNVIKLKQQLVENLIALEIAAGEYLPIAGDGSMATPATLPATIPPTETQAGKETQ
jgi:outer membrane protein TolC